MPRDPRTFITVHDGMPDHPKIEVLSDAAFRLLITCWCYCSRNETDGKIKVAVWSKKGTPKARRELLEMGLVEPAGEVVMMHDYTEHQRTAAEIAELRAKRAEAGAKGGKVRAKRQASAKANGQASASTVAKQTSSKIQAETDLSVFTDKNPPGGEAAETSQQLIAEWIDHCNGRPPSNVVGQVSKQVKQMLDSDGIPYRDVRAGLASWQQKSLHPSALASVVHEVRNPRSNVRPIVAQPQRSNAEAWIE